MKLRRAVSFDQFCVGRLYITYFFQPPRQVYVVVGPRQLWPRRKAARS